MCKSGRERHGEWFTAFGRNFIHNRAAQSIIHNLNKQSLRVRKDEGPQRIGQIRVIPLFCFTNPLARLLKLHISVSFIVELLPESLCSHPQAERTYTAPHFHHFHNVLTQREHQNNMSESVSDVWEERETDGKRKILIEMKREQN